MQLPLQTPTAFELRQRWSRMVCWVVCTLAVNLAFVFLLAAAATRVSPVGSKSEIARNAEMPRSKGGSGSCRVLAGTKIRSL